MSLIADVAVFLKASSLNKTLKSAIEDGNLSTSILPPGLIMAFGGSVAPSGWLLCNGLAVSRTTYLGIFNAIGTSYGSGDGSTTFNLPDLRGNFIRGVVGVSDKTFQTTDVDITTETITVVGHSFNRTGFQIRFTSTVTLPSPLVVGTSYFAIVTGLNTFKVAASLSDAIAGTAINLTTVGTGIHTVIQFEDGDASSRSAITVGGSSGQNVGAYQSDAIRNITGRIGFTDDNATNYRHRVGAASGVFQGVATGAPMLSASGGGAGGGNPTEVDLNASLQVPTGSDNRPKNVLVNYIIKT
jgi:microcystin-dependent protein